MDFPTKYISSVIKSFEYNERNKDQQDDFVIPPNLYEELKSRIVVEILFCKLNEKRLAIFRKKFNYFTNDSYDLNVVWKTKKVKVLFPLKDKNLHPSCKIYYVHVEKIMLERPKETFLYVMMSIVSPLISQNHLHTLNRTKTIISLGRFYATHHQMLEHVRISRRFL